MAKVPRFYQWEAAAAFIRDLDAGFNPLLALPTGAGKSLVLAIICKLLLEKYPWLKIVIATHKKELISQDLNALLEYWPFAPVGVFSASHSQKVASLPITICGIKTAANSPESFGFVHLVLVDEAHLVAPDEETGYQKFFGALRVKNPKLRVGGLSATIYRMKGGYLHEQGLFNKVAYNITGVTAFEALVKMGFLMALTSNPTDFYLETDGVKTSAGDFNQKELQTKVATRDKTEKALDEAFERGQDRKHQIIFCAGIRHIQTVYDVLEEWGESCAYVHSDMSPTERDAQLNRFTRGDVRSIASDEILTTGFDSPWIDHIITLRPTKSVVRHVQGLGRGTRPYYVGQHDLDTEVGRFAAIQEGGKLDCLVSDFGKNLERLGPINDPIIPGRKLKKGEMPIKICTTDKLVSGIGCREYNFAAARHCCKCGGEFIWDDQPKLKQKADNAIATKMSEVVARWVPVDFQDVEVFIRPMARPALRVTYGYNINRYTELVSLEHDNSYVRHLSRDWFRERGVEPPETTKEGYELRHELQTPTFILVQLNLRHPKIIQCTFEKEMPELESYEMPNEYKAQRLESA